MTKTKEKKYKPGEHPKSLANLVHNGRPPAYGTEKKQRYLTITEEGWEGAQAVVKEAGCTSMSDLIEKLGRGHLKITTV
jgi:hypothetical protein